MLCNLLVHGERNRTQACFFPVGSLCSNICDDDDCTFFEFTEAVHLVFAKLIAVSFEVHTVDIQLKGLDGEG